MEIILNRTEKTSKSGISDFFQDGLPESTLENMFKNAKTEIIIFSTYITPSRLNLESVKDAAMRRNVSVRVLLLQESSDIMRQRLTDLGYNENATLAIDSNSRFRQELNLRSKRIKLRFHKRW